MGNPILYNDPFRHCVWDACLIESSLIIGAFALLGFTISIQAQNLDISYFLNNSIKSNLNILTLTTVTPTYIITLGIFSTNNYIFEKKSRTGGLN